ncbi:MAG TPA: vanadium-dependent haloperoxidase [Ktedonobacteraceae bacterium]
MKRKNLIVATSIGIVLVIGALVATLVLTSTLTTGAKSNTANTYSGAIVIAWNKELLHIVLTPGAQPATVHPTRSYAILHAAIYDAVVSITRDGSPYLFSVPAPSGARPDAAAAQAGHDTLVALYPKWKAALDQQLAGELAAIPNGAAKQQGIQVGQAVATRLIAIRANDGSAATPQPFVPGTQPGNYRLTPPKFAAPVFTSWSNVTPFVLNNAAQFRPAPPPALTSRAYAQAINEVKSLGQNTSTTRTAEQTTIGKFWGGPIWNTWNEIAENAALAHHTNLETSARLFAALNLSLADSTISFYDAKYYYQLWRPVTAIRLADTDGNPATVGDPTWTPLAPTALDPSYPGAHSTISSAGATVLSAFFGNQDQIRVTSDVLPGVVRTFTSYSNVATEAGLSRIYAGQHTRLDHEAGLALGHDVAQFVLPHFGLHAGVTSKS